MLTEPLVVTFYNIYIYLPICMMYNLNLCNVYVNYISKLGKNESIHWGRNTNIVYYLNKI